jgi:hypothetical protein
MVRKNRNIAQAEHVMGKVNNRATILLQKSRTLTPHLDAIMARVAALRANDAQRRKFAADLKKAQKK